MVVVLQGEMLFDFDSWPLQNVFSKFLTLSRYNSATSKDQ